MEIRRNTEIEDNIIWDFEFAGDYYYNFGLLMLESYIHYADTDFEYGTLFSAFLE